MVGLSLFFVVGLLSLGLLFLDDSFSLFVVGLLSLGLLFLGGYSLFLGGSFSLFVVGRSPFFWWVFQYFSGGSSSFRSSLCGAQYNFFIVNRPGVLGGSQGFGNIGGLVG